MRHCILVLAISASATGAFASWYWPFGGGDEKKEPRISELMEPATRFIDSASDYADDGKVDEAIAEYRKALEELARIEWENPERAEKPEFATVRNKRAYIESSIDSLLLKQARDNARAVSVTDTTELEKKYRDEVESRDEAGKPRPPSEEATNAMARAEADAEADDAAEEKSAAEETAASGSGSAATAAAGESADASGPPPTGLKAKMLQARNDFRAKDYAAASLVIREILAERPDHAPALNLRGLVELASGRAADAERTFDRLIKSNPEFYPGYYNMARTILRVRGEKGKDAARRYYETGRDYYGGPADKALEEKFK